MTSAASVKGFGDSLGSACASVEGSVGAAVSDAAREALAALVACWLVLLVRWGFVGAAVPSCGVSLALGAGGFGRSGASKRRNTVRGASCSGLVLFGGALRLGRKVSL